MNFWNSALCLSVSSPGHVVAHHRHRIDHVLRGERILGEVLARFLGILVDEVDALLPHRGEAPGDVGAVLDEVAGDGAARRERVAVLVVEDVLGDDPGLDRPRDAELAHGRGLRLERIAGVEGAGRHDVDVLGHVELVDRVVALLEADLGEDRLGGDEVGRSGRRHDLRPLEVLERLRRMTLADDELLHLVDLALAMHADIHGDAGLLEIGVHRLDGHEHDRDLDLVADHRRDIGRSAHQPDRLRLDVLLLEESALDPDEIGQRRSGREHADLHLVLRRRRLCHGTGQRNDRPQPPRPQSARLHRTSSLVRDIRADPQPATSALAPQASPWYLMAGKQKRIHAMTAIPENISTCCSRKRHLPALRPPWPMDRRR